MFADFGGKYKKGNVLICADYRINYLNGLEEFYYNDDNKHAHSIYAEQLPKSLMATVSYMVSNKEVPTKVNFHLKTTGTGRVKTEHYTQAESKQAKFVMIDLGIRRGFNLVQGTGKKLKIESELEDGGIATQIDPARINTMMDYVILQGGVSFGQIGFWKADIEEYGGRREDNFVRYYVNALYLLDSKIDPVYYDISRLNSKVQSDMYARYELNNSKRSKLGICIGATLNNIDRFGIQGGAEIGYMPGIAGSFKSNLSITLHSNLSIGRVFKKEE